MANTVNRRDFLKSMIVGGTGLAGLALGTWSSKSKAASRKQFNIYVPEVETFNENKKQLN